MTAPRLCSKTPCGRPAVATLTYVYADSQIVLGALATYAEPHSYDLCAEHARRLTPPRGWEVIRLVADFVEPEPAPDELVAVADAVRRRPAPPREEAPPEEGPRRRTVVSGRTEAAAGRPVGEVTAVEVGRRGHLRVLRDETPDVPADGGERQDDPRAEGESR